MLMAECTYELLTTTLLITLLIPTSDISCRSELHRRRTEEGVKQFLMQARDMRRLGHLMEISWIIFIDFMKAAQL